MRSLVKGGNGVPSNGLAVGGGGNGEKGEGESPGEARSIGTLSSTDGRVAPQWGQTRASGMSMDFPQVGQEFIDIEKPSLAFECSPLS